MISAETLNFSENIPVFFENISIIPESIPVSEFLQNYFESPKSFKFFPKVSFIYPEVFKSLKNWGFIRCNKCTGYKLYKLTLHLLFCSSRVTLCNN